MIALSRKLSNTRRPAHLDLSTDFRRTRKLGPSTDDSVNSSAAASNDIPRCDPLLLKNEAQVTFE
jgi:hypothetical protein